MRTIFYGLQGEGLGHACRAQAILERLTEYEVHLFTWGEAYDFFSFLGYPHLHWIDGVSFGRKDDQIDVWRTICNFAHYMAHAGKSLGYMTKQAKKYDPVLFISDFEGITARAARKCSKPLLSISSQHKFSRTDPGGLPFHLRAYAFFIGLYTEWICKPDYAIVTTFYHSRIWRRQTALADCFMRKHLEDKVPSDGRHVLVYYKMAVGHRMLQELAKLDEKVVVYGCPPQHRFGNFIFKEIGSDEFIDDLASCKAVFCPAGIQLLGEAIFYGKKVLVVPIPSLQEQAINAFYLQASGYGMACSYRDFNVDIVKKFIYEFRPRVGRPPNGVDATLVQIRLMAGEEGNTNAQ